MPAAIATKADSTRPAATPMVSTSRCMFRRTANRWKKASKGRASNNSRPNRRRNSPDTTLSTRKQATVVQQLSIATEGVHRSPSVRCQPIATNHRPSPGMADRCSMVPIASDRFSVRRASFPSIESSRTPAQALTHPNATCPVAKQGMASQIPVMDKTVNRFGLSVVRLRQRVRRRTRW